MIDRSDYLSKPIRSLQTMLRTISEADKTIPSVVPDGIYGENTMQSVSAIQRKFQLPVTGSTDNTTWNYIVDLFTRISPSVFTNSASLIAWQPGQQITAGESNLHLFLIQSMFLALRQTFLSIPPVTVNGILDADTTQAILWLQKRSGIEATGIFDQNTWLYLTRLYRITIADGTDSQTLALQQTPPTGNPLP